MSGDCLERRADVPPGTASEVGFDLRCGPDGKPGFSVRAVRAALSRGLDRFKLRIFVDKRVVEVYANDGEAAVYTAVDASPPDTALAAVSQQSSGRGRGGGPPVGNAPAAAPRIEASTVWPMKPAQFSLVRFARWAAPGLPVGLLRGIGARRCPRAAT
jgi:hypothetical protein